MIAINKEYLSEPVPEYDTDCEIVWAKIRLVNNKDLYLAAYYNPKTSNEQSLFGMGWDWKTKTLKDNTPYPKIHTKFKDILAITA